MIAAAAIQRQEACLDGTRFAVCEPGAMIAASTQPPRLIASGETFMQAGLDPTTREIYREAMIALGEAGVPYLVGGAYAMERYTGIARHTKDFDILVRPADVPTALGALAASDFVV